MKLRFPLPFAVRTCSFSLESVQGREYRDVALTISFEGVTPSADLEATLNIPYSGVLDSFYVYNPTQAAGETINTQWFTPPTGARYLDVEIKPWLDAEAKPFERVLLHAETDWQNLNRATIAPEEINDFAF